MATYIGINDTPLMDWAIGVDIGRKRDYSAISVISEPAWDPEAGRWVWLGDADRRRIDHLKRQSHSGDWSLYRPPNVPIAVHAIERLPLGSKYEEVVGRVLEIRGRRPLSEHAGIVVVDATGIGDAVVEMFADRGAPVCPVVITGGQNVTVAPDGSYHVPHVRLIGSLDVAFDNNRLKLPADLPALDMFTRELQSFEGKRSPDGLLSYDQIRQDRHGHADMVLATALAVWYRDHYHSDLDRTAHEAARWREAPGGAGGARPKTLRERLLERRANSDYDSY